MTDETALARRHRIAAELRTLNPDRPAGRKTARRRAPRVEGVGYVLTSELSGLHKFLYPAGFEVRGAQLSYVRAKATELLRQMGIASARVTIRRGRDYISSSTLHSDRPRKESA